MRMPTRRSLSVLATAVVLVALPFVAPGCKSKAQKEAESAQGDVGRLQKLVVDRHVDSLSRALPDAASKLAPPLDEAGAGAKFVQLREKSDDLRASKRSFFALVDTEGTITWV